jgi:hypothetical protein
MISEFEKCWTWWQCSYVVQGGKYQHIPQGYCLYNETQRSTRSSAYDFSSMFYEAFVKTLHSTAVDQLSSSKNSSRMYSINLTLLLPLLSLKGMASFIEFFMNPARRLQLLCGG